MDIRTHTTSLLIEQLQRYTPKSFLRKIKSAKKFLYLTGNTFHSLHEDQRKEVFIWFDQKSITLPSSLKLSFTSALGEEGTQVETYPTFSGKESSVIAFPRGNYHFCWSPLINNLNLFLKQLPSVKSCVHDKEFMKFYNSEKDPTLPDILSQLKYKVEHNFNALNTVLRLKKEMLFSSPPDGWLLIGRDELDFALFVNFLKKF